MTTALAFVTGAGMVSALGLDLASSTAAARAGIRRAKELRGFKLASLDEGQDVFPIGHSIDAIARGFVGKARLLTLLTAALSDLEGRGAHEPDDASPFYLCLPAPNRAYADLDLIEKEDVRKSREEEAKSARFEPPNETAEWLLKRAYVSLGRKYVPPVRFAGTGRLGFALALRAAAQDLTSGAVRRAIVGGVDSLMDAETLTALHERARLKYVDMPVGIEPGEGAGFVVLEREVTTGPQIALTAVHVEPPRPGPFATLPAAIRAASAQAGFLAPGWLLADHDGTEERANDLGHAFVRLRAEGRPIPEATYPAASFGDTGASLGVLSTCLALGAWSRRWAPAGAAMIVCSDRALGYSAHVLSSS